MVTAKETAMRRQRRRVRCFQYVMALTIDDCMALAARESATEAELRAAVCVAVGQALHYRYEASGYRDAAEVAKRDAHVLGDTPRRTWASC